MMEVRGLQAVANITDFVKASKVVNFPGTTPDISLDKSCANMNEKDKKDCYEPCPKDSACYGWKLEGYYESSM